MKYTVRSYVTIVLILLPVLGYAQAAPDEERGWVFSQRFQGSRNATGLVMKTNSTVGYDFNKHVQTYAGVPFYFVRPKSSGFSNGVGNAFTGLLVSVDHEALTYSSATGEKDRGFSTGHVTVDWTNTFSKSFTAVTPYASIGVANTISDTAFFVRPFSSKGAVTHFEAGALISIAPRLSVGASGYGLQATGEQQVISKVVKKPETTSSGPASNSTSGSGLVSTVTQAAGLTSNRVKSAFEDRFETITTANVANDRGLSTWISLRPDAKTDFQIGYSRSATYQLNSMFFGMGFRVGH
jgi:hypothetical protein